MIGTLKIAAIGGFLAVCAICWLLWSDNSSLTKKLATEKLRADIAEAKYSRLEEDANRKLVEAARLRNEEQQARIKAESREAAIRKRLKESPDDDAPVAPILRDALRSLRQPAD